MRNITVAIVYHSGYGHTARKAAAVWRGANAVEGVTARLYAVEGEDAPWAELTSADALIFGAPTYMGGQSAQFKAFQDATSRTVFAAGALWRNKVAAGFTNSASRSGDKLATLQQLGFFMGAAAQSNADEPPELAPPQADLLTAEHLGRRVAEVALQLMHGEAALAG